MVWFQCEDCGENLKKPKLANHFRICSAYKLSCIDCGQMFSQDSVQSHTQCITEAEKYGPKDQGRASHSAQAKPNKPKPNSEVDVNVGLSSHAPWFCSLCNTQTTSKQTLMLHADGKKHRAKARAFHAAQKQSSQAEEPASTEKGAAADVPKLELVEANGSKKADEPKNSEPPKDRTAAAIVTEGDKQILKKSKRKHDASSGEIPTKTEKSAGDLNNGEVIQAVETEKEQPRPKKVKCSKVEGDVDKHGQTKEPSKHKIKWKKLVTSTLKSNPDGEMKIRKLQKLVIKALQESGITEEESQLRDMLMNKINSSSRFVADSKRIRLAPKNEES